MTGDPAYAPWPLSEQIDNPFSYADPAPRLRDRVAMLSPALSLDAERIVAWSAARRGDHEGDRAGGPRREGCQH